MNPFIYVRALRYVEHSVFSVADGQKFYRDPLFGNKSAYSSGQQVKRSIIERLTSELNVPFAALTFNWEIKGAAAEMKQPFHLCDPSFPDQLIGGYMKSITDEVTIKRRSPLSISAMRPLHPLLGGLENDKEAANFDRKGHASQYKTSNSESATSGANNVRVFKVENKKQVELTKNELEAWLNERGRQLTPHFYKPDAQSRATGLFVYDVAIDLRTLFCVSVNQMEPEVNPETLEKLKTAGWVESENVFGRCLVCPEAERSRIITALADALLNWRITSNQSRTFSLMETLAVAVSDNANQVAYAIRAELDADADRRANPVIDETSTAKIFLTPSVSGAIKGVSGNAKALDDAAAYLQEKMLAFSFAEQMKKEG